MYSAGSQASLHVCEIYASIMGESTYAGWPGVVVRLAGCPLRCVWCDSPQACRRGEELPLGEILQRIEATGQRLVLLTGGEPLAQFGSRHLVGELLRLDYQVLIETGGGVSVQGIDPRACIVLDIKCPSSGMQERQVWENLDCLKPKDEVKFVVASRGDYEWARDFLRRTNLADRHVVHFSPVEPGWERRQAVAEREAAEETVPPAAEAPEKKGTGRGRLHLAAPGPPPGVPRDDLAAWILADRLPVRLNLQLHVWIWGADARRV